MGWQSCDTEMLKLNSLVSWVGGLIDQGHGGGLICGKTHWWVGCWGYDSSDEGGLELYSEDIEVLEIMLAPLRAQQYQSWSVGCILHVKSQVRLVKLEQGHGCDKRSDYGGDGDSASACQHVAFQPDTGGHLQGAFF